MRSCFDSLFPLTFAVFFVPVVSLTDDVSLTSTKNFASVESFQRIAESEVSVNTMRELCSIANGLPSECEDIRNELYRTVLAGLAYVGDYKDFYALQSRISDKMGKLDYQEPCRLCEETGFVTTVCKSCLGTGDCPACGNLRRQEERFRTISCQKCGNSGRCDVCKGIRTIRIKCDSCKGKGWAFSGERAFEVYAQSLTIAKARIEQHLAYNPSDTSSQSATTTPTVPMTVKMGGEESDSSVGRSLQSRPADTVPLFKIPSLLQKCSRDCEIEDVITATEALLQHGISSPMVKEKMSDHPIFQWIELSRLENKKVTLNDILNAAKEVKLGLDNSKQIIDKMADQSKFQNPIGDGSFHQTYVEWTQARGSMREHLFSRVWKYAFLHPKADWMRVCFSPIPDGLAFEVFDIDENSFGKDLMKISIQPIDTFGTRECIRHYIANVVCGCNSDSFDLILSTANEKDAKLIEKIIGGQKLVVSSGWMLGWVVKEGIRTYKDSSQEHFQEIEPTTEFYNYQSFCEWLIWTKTMKR